MVRVNMTQVQKIERVENVVKKQNVFLFYRLTVLLRNLKHKEIIVQMADLENSQISLYTSSADNFFYIRKIRFYFDDIKLYLIFCS